jgi:L-alanine-DL-glutamate epimerase-like enolase superfamily enzyme
MARAAADASARGHGLLKLKLAGPGDLERVAAVHAGAPAARLIVDANEAWTGLDVAAQAAALLPFGVELIEQPVAAGRDALLDGVRSPIPLCRRRELPGPRRPAARGRPLRRDQRQARQGRRPDRGAWL